MIHFRKANLRNSKFDSKTITMQMGHIQKIMTNARKIVLTESKRRVTKESTLKLIMKESKAILDVW